MWAVITTNLNLPRFSPTCFAQRKVREISKCCRNCSQGSYSYFTFPLDGKLLQMLIQFDKKYRNWERCQNLTRPTSNLNHASRLEFDCLNTIWVFRTLCIQFASILWIQNTSYHWINLTFDGQHLPKTDYFDTNC